MRSATSLARMLPSASGEVLPVNARDCVKESLFLEIGCLKAAIPLTGHRVVIFGHANRIERTAACGFADAGRKRPQCLVRTASTRPLRKNRRITLLDREVAWR